MGELTNDIRIAIFGDSISEGIGSRKNNYTKHLHELLNQKYNHVIIDNYAFTGTMISYINDIRERWVNKEYDVIIIAYGNVDAMLRPNLNSTPNIYSILPNRYKQNGMLNPRPYFSKRWYKSLGQHIDSWFRWNLNRFLLKVQGSTTWISNCEFRDTYDAAVHEFSRITNKMILCSTVKVSEKYFPGTNSSYIEFNKIIKSIADKYKTDFLNLYEADLEPSDFYFDCFHPNEKGYMKIAKMIFEEICTT